MTKRTRKRHLSSNATGLSDEYLTVVTRGLYMPELRDQRHMHKGVFRFEDTCPHYPFLPLLGIVFALAARLTGRRQPRARRLVSGDIRHVDR